MVGGVLGLRLMHTIEPTVKLDILAMLGFIIMAGVVVNAAILLVEQALNHMQEGMPPHDAIIESARNRLRPIFMTSSSILGFLPLVLASGAGSELYRGMGAVQLGGMTALHPVHPGAGAHGILSVAGCPGRGYRPLQEETGIDTGRTRPAARTGG